MDARVPVPADQEEEEEDDEEEDDEEEDEPVVVFDMVLVLALVLAQRDMLPCMGPLPWHSRWRH